MGTNNGFLDSQMEPTTYRKLRKTRDVDPLRVPFTEDINLGTLQSGPYVLQVTVEDRAARKIVSQQTAFYVE